MNPEKESDLPLVITYGCRLNISESQVIEDFLKNSDLSKNILVVHSCAVTQAANKESFSKVSQLIKHNNELPDSEKKKIFVTGCSAQLHPDEYLSMGVDRVIGNAAKLDIESYKIEKVKKIWSDLNNKRYTKDNLDIISKIESRTRGFVQIQNGCDHDCTFCVIYKARGKNRSFTVKDIVNQIKILIESGCNEIVLTGVDITDYGKDLDPRMSLAKLVSKILILVPDLKRLRLSSIDVAEIDDELFDLMIKEPRLLPYIHLSMQSGSDLILKRMKRRHLSKDIIKFCEKMLINRDDVVFGADIIAGFPTETDELFAETVKILTDIDRFIFLHVFPFSSHSGTPASRMPQINGKVIKERAKIIRNIGYTNLKSFINKKVGSIEKVLFENNNIGKTEQFLNVRLKDGSFNGSARNLAGKIKNVSISEVFIKDSLNNSMSTIYLNGIIES